MSVTDKEFHVGIVREQKNYNDVVSAGEGLMKQKWPVSACMELYVRVLSRCAEAKIGEERRM